MIISEIANEIPRIENTLIAFFTAVVVVIPSNPNQFLCYN